MTKHISRRIFALTALYVAIILGIFALQFTKGNAFSRVIGSMMVSGSVETDSSGKEKPQLPIHVVSNGVNLYVDEKNPVLAYSAGKSPVALEVTGFQYDAERFRILFSDGVRMSFVPEKRGDSDVLTISCDIPARFERISLPYKITRSARVERKDSQSLVVLGKNRFIFSGKAEVGQGAISFPASAPVVYYQTWIPAKGLVIADLPSIPASSSAEYERAVERFASAALSSLKASVSSGALSEPVVAAFVAEMGRIGMYRAAIESLPESYRHGTSRGYLTSPFLNDLERTFPLLVQKERQDRSLISRQLSEGNPACLEYPSLIPYLYDRGSEILARDVLRLAASLDLTAVSARQAAGILEAMMDMDGYPTGQENTLRVLADACERRIKNALVRVGDDLFLSDDGKTIDTEATFRVASILIRYGSNPSLAAWKAAGHLLAGSLLPFAGERASLPALFAFAEGGDGASRGGVVARADRILDAATLYPLVVTGNTYYPRAVSFAREAGAGVWAWTSAVSAKVSRPDSDTLRISARFPIGETHYMIVRGIKPFSRIEIYGMDFRTDPRFESYNSSGYVYDEESETLLLKMRHKAEVEEVVLHLGGEESPAETGTGAAAPASEPSAAE